MHSRIQLKQLDTLVGVLISCESVSDMVQKYDAR